MFSVCWSYGLFNFPFILVFLHASYSGFHIKPVDLFHQIHVKWKQGISVPQKDLEAVFFFYITSILNIHFGVHHFSLCSSGAAVHTAAAIWGIQSCVHLRDRGQKMDRSIRMEHGSQTYWRQGMAVGAFFCELLINQKIEMLHTLAVDKGALDRLSNGRFF